MASNVMNTNNTVAAVGEDRRVEEALVVITNWVREVRPKWFRWCCQCHSPVPYYGFREKHNLCSECYRDNIQDDYYGRYPAPWSGCRCKNCESRRAWTEANRGKRKFDKIACVWYTVGGEGDIWSV